MKSVLIEQASKEEEEEEEEEKGECVHSHTPCFCNQRSSEREFYYQLPFVLLGTFCHVLV